MFFIAIVIMLAFYMIWARSSQRAHITNYAFPEGLRSKFREAHPELTPGQQRQVFEGLRQWFMICNRAGDRFVSMPSQVVDEAWHTFILFTRNYEQFCRKAFGRFLHHTPAEAIDNQTTAGDGIRRAWRIACQMENIDPRAPRHLPMLFAMDAALAVPGGFHYELDCKPGGNTYCAGGIGCSSGCGSGENAVGTDSGCGGDCGGD
ncbi:MAG: hypothetical protein PVI98_08990 [Burkholderiales bacterium]